jgi:diguanylate cyclase (GGDEF)-like protein/PAS domain S-box-containing protein
MRVNPCQDSSGIPPASAGSFNSDADRSAAFPPSGELSPQPRLGRLADLFLMALLIGASVWLSLSIERAPDDVASVWVANGLLAGWLLSRPTALWPIHLATGSVAALAVRLLAGDGIVYSIALGAFNLLEVLIIAGMIRRVVPDVGKPGSWPRLGRIATGSTLGACAISGLLASAVVSAGSDTPYLSTFLIWYSAHVVGMVIVGTLTLVVHRKGIGLIDLPTQRWDFIASMLLIALVGGAVFRQSGYPLLFLVYPPLVFAVLRHRFAGVVGGVLVLAVIGSIAITLDHGPLPLLYDGSATERTIFLQLFIGVACLMSFPIALAMAERTRLSARMRASELGYRMLAEHSHDMVVRMRADGERLYVSPSARDILGWEPDEMLQPSHGLIHPDDRPIQQQAIATVLASGDPVTTSYRVRHKQGHYIWMEANARPIPGVDGSTTDVIFAARDITERMHAEEALQASRNDLEVQARTDSLTGLPNRRQFDERLALARNRPRQHDSALALMYIDIDLFKHVNDSHGHAAGDEVLRVFGQRLSACVRAGDLVARIGGDEFVVLVENLSSAASAELIARKLINAMGESITVDGIALHVTASVGIAFSRHPEVAKTLTSVADAALYAAKKAGGNTWRLVVAGDVAVSAGERPAPEPTLQELPV